MSISIHIPHGPLYPDERMQAVLMSAYEGNARRLEERIQALIDSGVARERISIVTLSECADCKGSGVVAHEKPGEGSMSFQLRSCERCPGICVDGKPIARMPAPRPLP